MILDQLPELLRLPASQKRQLAEELWQQAGDESNEVDLDPAIVALLESRIEEHAAGGAVGSSWELVEARVFGRHGA